jgi:hypothetical protein
MSERPIFGVDVTRVDLEWEPGFVWLQVGKSASKRSLRVNADALLELLHGRAIVDS